MPRNRREEADAGEKTDADMKRLKVIVAQLKEEEKIRMDQMIQDFLAHSELSEITFPCELSTKERAYLHFMSTRLGLKASSRGVGKHRQLTMRRATESSVEQINTVTLTPESLSGAEKLKLNFPLPPSPKDKAPIKEVPLDFLSSLDLDRQSTSRIGISTPKVPCPRRTDTFLNYRSGLPIWSHKGKILDSIEKNRVVFIKGSTGCGKTTQVGQFILDNATAKNKEVRIICTVPRRIAAVSVSERVAAERGEHLGQTVGYQIRLESCVSPVKTLLIYCTSGILLRSLASPGYRFLNGATHIIIDEVHERDRQTDFLLACLRDLLQLPQFSHIRLILMGADLNNELFSNYFGGEMTCPIIQVEGILFPVRRYYLEDILENLHYENYGMECENRENEEKAIVNSLVEKLQNTGIENLDETSVLNEEKFFPEVHEGVDDLIRDVWKDGDDFAFATFWEMVESEEISVNYQHSLVGVTMLMAVSVRGMIDYMNVLVQRGADINIKSKCKDCEFTAVEWASDHAQLEALKFLMEHRYKTKLNASKDLSSSSEKYQRLSAYLKSIDEERVDLILVQRLIYQIHVSTKSDEAILVFLPGYDEIVTLKHIIMTDTRLRFGKGTFSVFMLHSNIQTGDQRQAFEKPRQGVRKIVLSTNIAETSLTIEDIVHVIDSGKAKEKSFDSMTGVTQLRSVWISKASANQRKGRAGRCQPGVCYHLFSSNRYESMVEFPIPEIVRSSLQELCLHARSFMRPEMQIDKFFSKIPEPPAPIAVKKSVELLKIMGALDENELLTKLGCHLLDFPLEPFLGKALIYAVVFKCLDPIVTLVAIISYRDPFQLPSDPQDKQRAQLKKVEFARDSYSDHMAYLKAFQDWENSKMFSGNVEFQFCRENFLSHVTFEMVYAIRAQLIGQLRASGFVKTKGKGDLKELNVNSGNWAVVKGVLVATLYPNICGIDQTKKALYNCFSSKIGFHGSTTVSKKKTGVPQLPSEWIIFDEMTQQGTGNLIKGCTCVSTAAIALFAGSYNPYLSEDSNYDSNKLKINQWITLHGSNETISAIKFLRANVNRLLLKKLESPKVFLTGPEEKVIETIAAVLQVEDKAVGFKHDDRIGQWPKFVSGNLMSAPIGGN